ncbi:flagellar basal-body MS-ring/collar protein FliF [Panacagrimonas sp.]|uniref:flagellar basal-body MS-ring/collar protein FliF n=1 Tax=Panacagrimonas sp. TaxID=2480088 RepID=UPI003B51F77C
MALAETAAPPLPAGIPTHLRAVKDLPIVRQLLLLVGIAAAVAGGIYAFTWSQRPGQVVLFPELAGQDAAAASEVLRSNGIEYRLDSSSGALTVAAGQAHEARLLLASQGLPKASANGFEMMAQDPGLGVSSFLEGARYNHALETELSRSVALLAPVKAARVHLAIPKPTAFARAEQGASASVLVNLHPGRELEASQVQAIVHMVASSVSGLKPERVTVVDQFGRLKSGQDDDALSVSTEQFDYARRVEADYVRRIEQLLAPVTGAGKISTQVAAELDFSQTEEARESYAPDRSVLRAEVTSEQKTSGPPGPQGVPGALSNQPPQAQPALPLNALAGQTQDANAAPVNESRNASRSFEVDRTLSHTRQPVGRLKKLTVAVLVDDLPRPDGKGGSSLKPLAPEEIARVEALVRDAVGFDANRGDRVTVQNVSFMPELPIVEAAALPIWMQPQTQTMLRHGFGLLAVLVLIFAALRPALKVLLTPTPMPGPALQSTLGAIEHQPDARDAVGSRSRKRSLEAEPEEEEPSPLDISGPYEKKLHTARSVVAQDPKRVAQVVKSWLSEDGAP